MSTTISRRRLLAGMAILSASALMPWATRTWADAPDQLSQQEISDFLELSERLTGKPQLQARIAGRAYQGLLNLEPQFPARMRQLIEAMDRAGLDDMSRFRDFAADQPRELVDTAISIIRAWYLGFTGTVQGHSATDNTHFVTYTGALMYRPTLDATVIPTYSRGRTNYWRNPPVTLAGD
ncbi:sugar dehydrogenase complex small subunit [Halomonas caseinilytica]|uniref:sugar dehydrogenase complex small subunit n=1 Tax=Halomonas caseinilytica TaxID=438744 RepID=UPI0008492E15|nr:sugar dehydrogenase complex small subunit [Halomonas caseinilytica]